MESGRLSLRTMVFTGGAILMLVPALIAGTVYTGALQRRAETLLVEKLTSRGELSASLLARRLHQLWLEVEGLSKNIDLSAMPRVRQDIDFVSQLDQRYSWLGVTDVEGKVLASTRGLTGPTAIDVHEAQLLARLMPATPEPYRFIDLAAPLRRGTQVSGVIGAHLDWRWVVDNLKSLQLPGIDVLLLARDRVVLFGPQELVNKPLAIGSAQAANRVTSAVLDERWPDGKDYVTVVVPTVGHEDLPSFGWSLLIRQDMNQALGPTRELMRSFWLTLGAGALLALLLLFAGAWWITTPLRRLAMSVEGIVGDGDQSAPYRETRYDEVTRISGALVKIQSLLSSNKIIK